MLELSWIKSINKSLKDISRLDSIELVICSNSLEIFIATEFAISPQPCDTSISSTIFDALTPWITASLNKLVNGVIYIASFAAIESSMDGRIIWYALKTSPKVESIAPTGTSAIIGLFCRQAARLSSLISILNAPSESEVAENSPSSLVKLKFWSIKISAPSIYPSITFPENT